MEAVLVYFKMLLPNAVKKINTVTLEKGAFDEDLIEGSGFTITGPHKQTSVIMSTRPVYVYLVCVDFVESVCHIMCLLI